MNISRVTKSPEETHALGKDIGKRLSGGDIVAITGDLGAGKTCLSQGIGWGAGIDSNVYMTSPTFTLVKQYKGRVPIYHIDLFRMRTIEEVYELPIEDYFSGKGITIIEWADRIEPLLPKGHFRIDIELISENERRIKIYSGD